MDPVRDHGLFLTRRHFFGRTAAGIGTAALASLLDQDLGAVPRAAGPAPALHLPAKAKRVIYLFQSGAPSQADLFDPKPDLAKFRGQNLPDSVRMGQRLTGMTSGQKNL